MRLAIFLLAAVRTARPCPTLPVGEGSRRGVIAARQFHRNNSTETLKNLANFFA